MKIARFAGILLLSLVVLITFAWTFGALWFDGPDKIFAVLNGLAIHAAFVFVKHWRFKMAIFAGWFALVFCWWLNLHVMLEESSHTHTFSTPSGDPKPRNNPITSASISPTSAANSAPLALLAR